MSSDIYICLYSSCILVTGKSKAIVLDIQRNTILNIPLSISIILKKYNKSTLNAIFENEKEIEKENLMKYLGYLENEEIIFFTKYPENFPDLEFNFHYPSFISNSIVYLNNNFTTQKYLDLFKELNDFECRAILIIIDGLLNVCDFELILNYLLNSSIENIEIYVKIEVEDSIIKMLNQTSKVSNIILWGVREIYNHYEKIQYQNDNFMDRFCGNVDMINFNNHMYFLNESFSHNTCLNRKISIDAEGNIKNCPSMDESFGNISDTTLEEAINKPGFKKYWDVNKDKIHVCKDCEFRYICTDCRAYVEDPEDILSKPLKCGYNPYTGEWSEWSTNPLKQKAIDFYGMREMVDNMDKANASPK